MSMVNHVKPPSILQVLKAMWDDPFSLATSLALLYYFPKLPLIKHLGKLQASLLPPSKQEMLEKLTRERPDWDYLASLPKGTLGREWHDMSDDYNLEYPTRTFMEMHDAWYDIEPWPFARLFKTHDIHHLLSNYPPTCVTNEIRVMGFMLGSRRPDTFAAIDIVGIPLTAPLSPKGFMPIIKAYMEGIRAGLQHPPFDLLMYPYEHRWEWTLDEVRRDLGILP